MESFTDSNSGNISNTSKATSIDTSKLDESSKSRPDYHRPTSLSYIQGQHSHQSLPHRTNLDRRITWDESSFHKNPIVIPEELRQAGRASMTQAKEKQYASWFEGSPHDLEERREQRRESQEWLRDLRTWKKSERTRSRSENRERDEISGSPWYVKLLNQMKGGRCADS